MRIKQRASFKFLNLLMLALLSFGSAFSQSLNVPEDQETPALGSEKADLLGSIPNTDIDRIYKDRLDKGILIPEFGIEDIFMTKGSKETLDLEKFGFICIEPTIGNIVVSRDAPGDPKVPRKSRTLESVSEGTTMLIVTERAPGQTVCKSDERGRLLKVYRVTVTSKDLMQTLLELKTLIGGIEGLRIRVVGTKIILDGEIIVPAEIERFVRVKSQYKDVVDLVQVSAVSFQYLASKMEEQIAGGPDRPRDIRVKVVNERFFLEGSVDRKAQREEAMLICRSYIQPKLISEKKGMAEVVSSVPECVNLMWVRQGSPPDPDNIIVARVDFVNLKKSYLKEFNFSWNPALNMDDGIGFNSDAGKVIGAFVGTITNLFPKLRHAQSHGYGRVLKSATLLIRDNPNAPDPISSKVEESLEVPYLNQQIGQNGQVANTIESVTFKTSVTVKAQSIKGSDKIRLGLVTSNDTVGEGSVGGKPRRNNTTADTNLIVSSGESAAIAGMVTESRAVSYERKPSGGG